MDRTREACPDQCPWCGASIPKKQKPRKTQARIVVDLEKRERGPIKTRTLWKVHWIRCPNCGKLASGGSRVNAEKGCTYGYGVRAQVLYMYQEQRLTITDIAKNLELVLGEDTPTTQTVRDWINKTAQKNKPLLPKLLKLAKREKYLEVDETGIPIEGEKKKDWLWIIETKKVTIYLARRTRGHKAVEELLMDYAGIMIADFWKAYDKLPHRKQRSLAHLYRKIADPLRELVENIDKLSKKLRESENQHPRRRGKNPRGRGRPRKLETMSAEQRKGYTVQIAEWKIAAEAFYRILLLLGEALERRMNSQQAKEKMLSLLEENKAAESLNQDYRRVSKLIKKYIDEIFLFLDELDIPGSTNNAERGFKPYATMRRKTLCRRSYVSAEADADLLSYTVTWRKANLDPRELYPLLVRGSWKTVYQHILQAYRKPPPETNTLQTVEEVAATP